MNVYLQRSYLDLAKSLGTDRPIFVLDDGVVSTGKDFSFDSIEQVAESCLPLALEVIADHGKRLSLSSESANALADSLESLNTSNATSYKPETSEDVSIILGGWSYGGVVSYELAKRLMTWNNEQEAQESNDTDKKKALMKIFIQALVLFDAPFEDAHDDESNGTSSGDDHSNFPFANHKTDSADQSGALESQASVHFAACTSLLKKYRSSITHRSVNQQSTTILSCPILFFNPRETDNIISEGRLRQRLLTNSIVQIITVPGNHWTMLFGENSDVVSREMNVN